MKRIILFLLISICTLQLFGQSYVQGFVTDERHEPIVGASVVIKGTTNGQVTDRSGKFRIQNIKAAQTEIVISFIGYETQIVSINIQDNATATLNVEMKPGAIQLSDVVVTSSTDRPINTLSEIDIKFRPVNTSQDVLRMVPGLFIAQHAGGGKAEQIFLRGFDCDHGTDINVEVDGLPVNMVSHAHGQGYADLHFLMPEAINYVDFDKGPYFANKGDLNTAGYVAFETKNKLDRNFARLEGGSFNTGRVAAGLNFLETKKSNAYVISEFFKSDGFFDNNQNFKRFNLQAKFRSQLSERTTLTAAVTAFTSKWNASGQIPDRAVEEGVISRYGSIDPTEGGNTNRFNAYVKLIHHADNGGTFENQAYAIRYDFNLFSNFTFYLNDPVNGDQINQKDSRWVYGYKSRYLHTSNLLGKLLKTEVGAGTRYDVVNNIALDHTVKRSFLNHVMYGDIRELNANGYLSETLFLSEKFSVNAAVRLDYFHFSYQDKLNTTQPPTVGKAIVSPKFNINYQASRNVSLFVRSGTGFHSNDARVVVAQDGKKILPRAYGLDVGADVKIAPQLLVHTALWRLDLDQEFVYSGDEGIVEPSGKTKRMGIDASIRYQINSWLFADVDVNVTKPRAKGLPEGENYIPLAPIHTSIAGLTVRRQSGFNGSLRYRYIGDRPANEDNTIVAKGYFITDAIVNYTQKTWEIGASIENLFNTKWKEAQFATESRLKNEAAPVEEINFTPGTPFSLRLRFTKYF
ncbi:MAG TPA: TonB-dependent receptor [Cyclobacteriaceae bacterium]|jgi:outer membrane receptor protein involved in Fe transport|nr:TonB-dependent receptor [Cyclobacteriaceae bacterium]